MAADAPRLTIPQRRERPVPGWLRTVQHDWFIFLLMSAGLVIALIPILFMLNISLKTPGQFLTKPLEITFPFAWDNYVIAFNVLKRSILNTFGMTIAVVVLSLAVSSMAGYAFARFTFPGKDFLFWFYLSVLFIPDILTFATKFTVVERMGILDTYIVQILPYIANAQIFQTVVLRSFFSGISNEIVEAARVDGASVFQVFWNIVLPMSRPILATLAVLRAVGFWDEWVWPLVTITSYDVRPLGLQVFYLQSDIGRHVGRQMAGFVVASVPLIALFVVASKQFVEGLTSGAVKF
jgi:ABC-type glycerol-3-phosphate transport system permease component